MIEQVEKVIDREVRPFLQSHHGDLNVLSLEDGVVTIKLTGACSGCPHSDITTKDFIESKLFEALPWINRVELSTEVDPSLIMMAKAILNRSDRSIG